MKIRHMSKKIDIIRQYLDDYSKKLSGREIARLTNTNHQTALTHLNELVKEGILKYLIKGRNKEYHLNLTNLKTQILIEISESYNSLLSLNNKELNFIIKDIMPYTEAITLFGSFASGRHNKESDIDLILIGKSNKNKIKKIKAKYSRQINIEYVSFQDFSKSLKQKNALAIEILNNHCIYGDISKIVKIITGWYNR